MPFTGYGERVMMAAYRIDADEAETACHLHAAQFFRPDVDFVLDIGGQDIHRIVFLSAIIILQL